MSEILEKEPSDGFSRPGEGGGNGETDVAYIAIQLEIQRREKVSELNIDEEKKRLKSLPL